MNSSVFERRRSERFAELLDEASGRRRRHLRTDLDGGLGALVRLAGRVGEGPASPDADEEFRASLRTVLMATIDREGIGTSVETKAAAAAQRALMAGKTQAVRAVKTGRPARTGRTRAALLVGVTGALLLSGVSAASTGSLPGEALYQVKRSSEKAQLALAGSDQSRGQLYLEFAYSRLAEARKVGVGRLGEVLADMDWETRTGVRLITGAAVEQHDASALDSLIGFIDRQRQSLRELHKKLPADRAEAVRPSLGLLDEVEKRADALTVAIAAGCEFATMKTDDLGPVPDSCP